MTDRDSRPPPRVAVFDASLPPGLAFVRSLGARGIPVHVYGADSLASARLSRHATGFRSCPPPHHADEFVDWLVDELATDRFDLVALTSDYVAFAVTEAGDRSGRRIVGAPDPTAVRTCLFKREFNAAMDRVGFPVPKTAAPSDTDGALAAADSFGYPVVLKPRSHAGIGLARGVVVHDPEALRREFAPLSAPSRLASAARHDPDLAYPLVQEYLHDDAAPDAYDVVSISGVLDGDGNVLAVGHSRKMGRWPGRLGVGTVFERSAEEPFTEAALEAVQAVLGSGIFELEVVVHRPTGRHWAIDLNPRAFGQISLDIALGRDLPALWYESVTGRRLAMNARPVEPTPQFWHQGVPVWVGAAVALMDGADRRRTVRRLIAHQRTPHVGAAAQLADPLPGLAFGWGLLKHPRSLVRSVRNTPTSP